MKDCPALKSHPGILQTSLSSKPYILLSRNLMGGNRHIGYTEKLKSFHEDVKEGPALNSHLGIIQPTSSETKYPLEQKLDGRLLATQRLKNS